MPPNTRRGKKPRLVLSCLVCRQRKVRCGKEQPACSSCVRLNEKCVYQTTVRDESTGRVSKDAPTYHQLEDHNKEQPRPASEIEQENDIPLAPDHLCIQRGDRVRYVGKVFWGFTPGMENLADSFFRDDNHDIPHLPPLHVDVIQLANVLLTALPTKPICDALMQSFMISIYPILPLIDLPLFQANYNELWEFFGQRNNNSILSPEMGKIAEDPTFICLLFGIIYSGASVAPDAMWNSSTFQGVAKDAMVNYLRKGYTNSLDACQHLNHPTLNTLVSSLLSNHFMNQTKNRGQLTDQLFVSTVVRLAQSMGLHCEDTWDVLDDVSRDIRRRVWWHVIWLDVQSSVSTGLPTCARIGDISISDSAEQTQSMSMLYTIGRHETARLQHHLISHLQSSRMTQNNFEELKSATNETHQKIDTLIARIPVQGISDENGVIANHLANASPFTHPSLYDYDSLDQPTVFGTWVKLLLAMLKSEATFMFYKHFLPPPDRGSICKLWTRIVELSVNYLSNFLQIYQTPAFEPYIWFFAYNSGPLQYAFLILVYLIHTPDKQTAARFCVDGFVKCFLAGKELSLAEKVLLDLYKKLDPLPAANTPGAFDPSNMNEFSSFIQDDDFPIA